MKTFIEGDIFIAEGENDEFGCCRCSHIIQKKEAGFKCKHRVFCEACQSTWNKTPIQDEKFCLVDQLANYGEHEHIKFLRT